MLRRNPGKSSAFYLAIAQMILGGCAGGGPSTASSSGATSSGTGTTSVAALGAKPNIVFIVTDDLDVESIASMPKLQAFMVNVGASFQNSFASNPVCCPSRASMLRGQYSHNHRVWTNGRGNNTCFDDFRSTGLESSTVATWLQTAGYRTGLVGKYLNRYPATRAGIVEDTHVPAGWDEWFAVFNSDYNSDSYFNYFANDNKKVVSFGKADADYETDVLTRRAVDFIGRAKDSGKPFFLWIATTAPHAPSDPAPRHIYSQADKRVPRTPSFNEADLSDKPRWYRDNLPLMKPSDITDMEGTYKRRLETLQAVDDQVERVLLALDSSALLGSTYVIFTSDNGYLQGQHRFQSGKDAPYEESIRVPLIVRGPGVPAGLRPVYDVSNIDIAPTLAELGQAQAPSFVDGRSLVSLLSAAPPALASWRQEVLIEHEPADVNGLPSWFALRNSREKFIGYPATGEEEYYNLVDDPFETDSKHRALDPARKAQLKSRLLQLEGCSGASCR